MLHSLKFFGRLIQPFGKRLWIKKIVAEITAAHEFLNVKPKISTIPSLSRSVIKKLRNEIEMQICFRVAN